MRKLILTLFIVATSVNVNAATLFIKGQADNYAVGGDVTSYDITPNFLRINVVNTAKSKIFRCDISKHLARQQGMSLGEIAMLLHQKITLNCHVINEEETRASVFSITGTIQ